MIHLGTITPKMHEIARAVHDGLDPAYYLAGGTALALLSGHRESVDLDYFIPSSVDTRKLKDSLSRIFPAVVFTYEEVDTLWCEIDGVRVSFISRLAPLLDTPRDEDGFRIAGLRDLVVMKLNAICGRDEYKDYYDLAILADLSDAREWKTLWESVYPKSDPISWMVALAHVGSVSEIPLRGGTLRKKEDVEEALRSLVKKLSEA
jgi:hypothetical protein